MDPLVLQAAHEAAHAVAAASCGHRVTEVSIRDGGCFTSSEPHIPLPPATKAIGPPPAAGYLAAMRVSPLRDQAHRAGLDGMYQLLSGVAAEGLLLRGAAPRFDLSSGDLARAGKLAAAMWGDAAVTAAITRGYGDAQRRLLRNWAAVDAVAGPLYRRRHLDGPVVMSLIARHRRPDW